MMQETDVETRLEVALRLVEELRGKCRFHAQQTYAWRRAHAAQVFNSFCNIPNLLTIFNNTKF